MERVIKRLPVVLTREELEERSKTVARLSGEVADAERKIESEKESAKARVKEAEQIAAGLVANQRAVSRVVLEGREVREVSCTVRVDRRTRTRTLTREDTGEDVETRPLSAAEVIAGATWRIDLPANRATLVHPDEPDLVLDTRELTEAERQAELPVDPPKKGGKSKSRPSDAEDSPI